MESETIISIVIIFIALVVWFKARMFISSHIKEYNEYKHVSDFTHLRALKTHDDTNVADVAKKHHRNVKVTIIVIITVLLFLITQRVN